MARKLTAPIFLGVFTILALFILTMDSEKDTLRQTFSIEGIYQSTGNVEISYVDKSSKTESATLEILGMPESFQKTFSSSEFTEIVEWGDEPKYGWSAHPIILNIEHAELGQIQLKTEIHIPGEMVPATIYTKP